MQIQWSHLMLYDANNVMREAESKPGVYRLSTKLADGQLYVFYVGDTQNLRETLLHHLSVDEETNGCIQKHIRYNICYLKFAYVPEPAKREGVYKYLYYKCKGECNKAPPPGEPIEVNID